jgi:CO/xanthine dehydrogenase FAD-binding subunit
VAGGTWLFSEPQPGVRRLVDLTDIPWTPIERTDDVIRISATCTYDELEAGGELLGGAGPLFSRAIRTLSSSFKTYGEATLGGNICLAYAKSMMAPVCCALGATYDLATPEGRSRRVLATLFQIDARETIRRPGEYLRAILIPAAATNAAYALRAHSYTPTSHATAMVIATRQPGAGGNGSRAHEAMALVVSAATTHPVRVELAPGAREEDAAAAAVRVCNKSSLLDDAHGSAAYRRAVVAHLAARATAAVGNNGSEEVRS